MGIDSIGGTAAAVSSASSASTGNAVALTVLKKALDVQAQSALQLLQTLPQQGGSATRPVGMVGNNVNTFA